MRVSDVIYYRPYQIKDNFGRDYPGAPSCACMVLTPSH
jgi:hypothetical protein